MREKAMNTKLVVIGQAFGWRHGPNGTKLPGLSNEVLARTVASLNADVISVQWEIGSALQAMGITPDHQVFKHQTAGKYLDTIEVLRQEVEFLGSENLLSEQIRVVAHPDHMSRVMRELSKLGVTNAVPVLVSVPYDPKSAQVWTRSRLLFTAREAVVNVARWFGIL
jgi:hypothetical protein